MTLPPGNWPPSSRHGNSRTTYNRRGTLNREVDAHISSCQLSRRKTKICSAERPSHNTRLHGRFRPEFGFCLPDLVTLPTLRGEACLLMRRGILGFTRFRRAEEGGLVFMITLITYFRFEVSRGMESIQSAEDTYFGNSTPHAEIRQEFRIQQVEISY
jgi:hypothetical protein